MPAGNYVANIVYTATVEQLRQPILTSVAPSTYELGSGADNAITITGKYLSTASKVYLVHASTGEQYYCTDLQLVSTDASGNTTLTCNVPTDQTDPNIEPDTYGVYVLTNAGETAYTDAATFTYTKSSICRNNDPDSDCQVDIDDNMIPVVYEGYDGNGGGNWRIVTKEEIENNKGSWYDYGKKQWANAITLRDDYEGGCYSFRNDLLPERVVLWTSGDACYDNSTIQHYTPLELAKMIRDESSTFNSLDNANASLFDVDVSDGTSATEVILGYWVYIPRYAYEVQRRDAVDAPVDPQNFNIVFETAEDTVKTPAKCTLNTAEKLTADINSSILYQDCIKQLYGDTGLEYPGNDEDLSNGKTAWATHPAFTWQYTEEANGFNKTYELNGIWVGKFETTGKISAPTVKPNQHANISEYIGEFYTAAKNIGVEDTNNQGGNTVSNITPNSHHLDKATSHMLKNSEWGAITYLAHSKYGAGINTSYTMKSNVSSNGATAAGAEDADGNRDRNGYSAATGCGPVSAGNTDDYSVSVKLDANIIESDLACGSVDKAYNGETGTKASTTNNIYGVYDLAGGVVEKVMGNRTTNVSQTTSSATYFETPAKSPYVDLYVATPNGPFGTKPSWSSGSSEPRYNYDVCTFETCGGTATYETTTVQSVSSYAQSWGETSASFAHPSLPWFSRGGTSIIGDQSLFYTAYSEGEGGIHSGFRAALLALPAGR